MKQFTSFKKISGTAKIMLVIFLLLIRYTTDAQVLTCNAHFIHQSASTSNNVYFNPFPNPPGTSYNWTFGDGGTSNIPNPVHIYSPGNYLACLTVTIPASPNTIACTATYCDSIHVHNTTVNCNAGFTMQPGNSINNILFTNAPNPTGTLYLWTFGDGHTSNAANPSHTYVPGHYKACLTVKIPSPNGAILCQATYCDSVHISPSIVTCNAHFTKQTSPANANGVYFSGSANNPANTTYLWNYGDGQMGTGLNSYHVYAPGHYLACLTVKVTGPNNSILCTSTFCDSIHISPTTVNCSALFTHQHSASNNLVENFTGPSNPTGTIYNWSFGDGASGTGKNISHTYAPGHYKACLTVAVPGSPGVVSCTATYCDSVYISPNNVNCNAHFTFQNGAMFNSYNFTSSPNPPGTQYLWTFGNGITSTAANPVHTFAPGHYKVCLKVKVFGPGTNVPLCTTTFCDSIHVINTTNCLADFNFTKVANALRTYSFTNWSSANATSYFWHFGDATTSTLANPVHQYATAGPRQVCLTIFDNVHQCSNTKCKTISVSTAAIIISADRESKVEPDMNDISDILLVNVFPNPTSNNSIIHIENAKSPVTFIMYDNTGKVSEKRTQLDNGDFELNNSNRASGIYFYRVISDVDGYGSVSGKLILQK